MKKLLLLLLAMVGVLAVACEPGGGLEEENGGTPSVPKIELSQQTVNVEFEPDTYTVEVTSPYSWEAISKNDWITIATKSGIAGTKTLKFSVERNEEEEVREGTIVIKNEDYDLVTELYVIQKAFVPSPIIIEPETLNFAFEGGEQEVKITSNFEYEVTVSADWASYTKTENGITVTVPNYVEVEERTAEIIISSEKYNISKVVKVTQNGLSEEDLIRRFFYTSSDGKIVTPYITDVFGANIVSNTYENGKGVILFDAPVTSIGESAFYNCKSLTSVTIPNSVTSIGGSAFSGCSSLTSVYYKGGLSAWCKISFINAYANPLNNGTKLYLNGVEVTDITIPSDITEIKDYTFYGCTSLTSVTIPDSVTSIGSCAFSGCTGELTVNCNIPSASSYDYGAFYNSKFTKVTIGDSVTSIGNYAFYDCSSLTSITIPDSATKIGTYAFCGCTGELTVNCNIRSAPSSYYAEFGAFYNSKFTKVTIGDSVTSIGDFAFYYCTSLTSVTIGDSVTSIGDFAFWECTSLTSVTIGDSVTSIGYMAFADCTSLTSVTIPDSVTSIEYGAFGCCTSLTSVTIGNSVISIGDYAFAGCTSLTSVTIGNSVTSIGDYAFAGCTSLKSVTIPDSVTSIGDYAFAGCTSLKEVYCKPATPPTGDSYMFNNNASGRKIYVPRNSVEAYKAAQYWSDYASYIEGYDF